MKSTTMRIQDFAKIYRIMKFFAVTLLGTLLQYRAKGYSTIFLSCQEILGRSGGLSYEGRPGLRSCLILKFSLCGSLRSSAPLR